MKTMIFLGAGASASEGAPVQNSLFRNYFDKRNINQDYKYYDNQLAALFGNLFGINVKEENLDNVTFPTFEEVLGLLDIARQKDQSFVEVENNTMVTNSNQINTNRDNLNLLLARCLDDCLTNENRNHSKLVSNLKANNLLKDTIFVSTNYDLLIDNALMFQHDIYMPDYLVKFYKIRNSDYYPSLSEESTKLIKLHGSLNWLYCKTCDEILLTPGEKGVVRLLENIEENECEVCNSYLQPIIIPPTFFKNTSNYFINRLFKKFDEELKNTDHIIFCGYSFPDADLHLKYYLKRAEMNLFSNLRITVINNHTVKNDITKAYEKENYCRFFSCNVNYTEKSFEEFADNPSQFY